MAQASLALPKALSVSVMTTVMMTIMIVVMMMIVMVVLMMMMMVVHCWTQALYWERQSGTPPSRLLDTPYITLKKEKKENFFFNI